MEDQTNEDPATELCDGLVDVIKSRTGDRAEAKALARDVAVMLIAVLCEAWNCDVETGDQMIDEIAQDAKATMRALICGAEETRH
jgi:hypothetical protein